MSFARRQFMQGLGLSAAALTLPGWMSACSSRRDAVSAVDDAASEAPPNTAHEALERARRRGRPLLVLVVPASETARSDRYDAWGGYLFNVDDEGLADLALCDVWCAKPAVVSTAFAGTQSVDDDTLAVLVETDGRAPRIIAGPLAPMNWSGYFGSFAASTDELKEHIDRLRERLRAAIAPDASALEARAAVNRTARSAAEWRSLGLTLGDDEPPSQALAWHAPAILRLRAERASATERARCTSLLAQQAAARLRAGPAAPEHDSSGGCGAYPCGIAYTPAPSSRFLRYFLEHDP